MKNPANDVAIHTQSRRATIHPQGLSLTQEAFFCHSCRDFMALKIQPPILWLKVLTSSARFQADVVACESEMANAIF